MHCDRSSSTCTHWNLRRGARWWKLLRRHTPWTGFITALLTLDSLKCRHTSASAREPHAVWEARLSGCHATVKYFHFLRDEIWSKARSCLRLYNFNLVRGAARAKRVQSAGGVGAPEMVFYARLVFNGAKMWRQALGVWCFDTDGPPWEAAEKWGKKIKVKLKAVTW